MLSPAMLYLHSTISFVREIYLFNRNSSSIECLILAFLLLCLLPMKGSRSIHKQLLDSPKCEFTLFSMHFVYFKAVLGEQKSYMRSIFDPIPIITFLFAII